MKTKMIATLAVVALFAAMGTAYALDSAPVSQEAGDVESNMGEQETGNCHQWRHQEKPQYQRNEDDQGFQEQEKNQFRYMYQYNETCDGNGSQYKHAYKYEGEGPGEPNGDQSQDRVRIRERQHDGPGPRP